MNEWSSESLVSKVAVLQTPSKISKYCYGNYKKTFKERYNNHTATFRNKSKQKSMKLSKPIWELTGSAIQYEINWNVAFPANTLRKSNVIL